MRILVVVITCVSLRIGIGVSFDSHLVLLLIPVIFLFHFLLNQELVVVYDDSN